MKLVTFEVGGVERIGFLLDGRVYDLTYCHATLLKKEGITTPLRLANALIPPHMLSFLEGEERALSEARRTFEFVNDLVGKGKQVEGPNGERAVFSFDDVRLRAPIKPRLMIDFSTFEEHVRMGFEKLGMSIPEEWYRVPVGYKMNPYSVIGPEDPILWPEFTKLLDYELEFGVVVGKRGKNISKSDAMNYVLGYTIVNDVSARDMEFIELRAMPLGPLKSKDFDSSTPMGPCIVTRDEVKNPHNLRMVARVNGEVWSEANTSGMYWKIPDLISHLSRDQTIYPGTVFLSGTPGGGCGMHVGKMLKPGDVIELEIEGIGKLKNPVVKT